MDFLEMIFKTFSATQIFGATFIFGLTLWLIAGRMNYKKDKYEFENRTSGGTVEYKNYKHYTKSHNKFQFQKFLAFVGGLIWGLSLMVLVFLWAMNK